MSATPGDCGLTFLQVSCPQEPETKKGVIALAVAYHSWRGKKSALDTASFLLQVLNEDGSIFINLKEPWVSKSGRLGQILTCDRGGCIEVIIKGDIYTTDPHPRGHEQGKHIVGDANLLCRYLAETATAEEVEAAAEKYVAEVSASEELEKIHRVLEKLLENFGTSGMDYGERMHLLTEYYDGQVEILKKQLKNICSGLELSKKQINGTIITLKTAKFGNRKKTLEECLSDLQFFKDFIDTHS